MPTGTGRGADSAIRPSASSSSIDSTLICPSPAAQASHSSEGVFPTPLKTIRSAANPAARARWGPPNETDATASAEIRKAPDRGEGAVGLDGVVDPALEGSEPIERR